VANRPGLRVRLEDRANLGLELLGSVAPAAVAGLPPVQSAVLAWVADSPYLLAAGAELGAGGRCPAKPAPGPQPELPQVSGSRK
jgi:hypothetical protein